MGYKISDKNERNKRLVEFVKQHPTYAYRAIGKIFHISGARVCQILKMEATNAK